MSGYLDLEALNYSKRLPQEQQVLFYSYWSAQKKDPNNAMLFSLLLLVGLPGVGRLYIGDAALGLALMFLGWLTCGIWPLIDIFLISNATREKNAELLARLKIQFPIQG